MRLAPRTLVARVAWTTALSVAIASALVAVVAGTIATRLAHQREDASLTDAAETFALELRMPGADPLWTADDETRELHHADIQVTVFEGTRFLAGDRKLPWIPPNTCQDVPGRRACARHAAKWTAVAARRPTAVTAEHGAIVLAGTVAVLLTTLLGAVTALTVARWAVRPLFRLHQAVQELPADPLDVQLGADEQVLEVDALRGSLRSAFHRLGISLAQSRRFSSDAAHELRTPLTTILGELELALENVAGEDRDGLLRARRVAHRLAALVERLLVLARVEPSATMETIDPWEVVNEALDALAPSARARVVLSPVDGQPPCIRGDQPLLVAMLSNGLENALKFSQEQVRISLLVDGEWMILTIDDDGPGVPEGERAHVFLPFYRTRASRAGKVPGHGIGLALIAHVVTLHGGSVRFTDAARGARLEVRLPQVAVPDAS